LFFLAQGKSDDYVSGIVVLQNIQRIVDDNEKLKSELNQKTEVIDNLRDKIAKLHEKNEKYSEL
jgi:polyhydroxyalkanoate synthesis regulator phasin